MLMKNITFFYLTGLLIACSTSLHAQTIIFSYDAAGNRTERNVIVLSSLYSATETPTLSINAKPSTADKSMAYQDSIGGREVVIYPNPTLGELHIALSTPLNKERASYRLLGLNGSILQQAALQQELTDIDLTNVQPGIYLLELIIDEQRSKWKIIKQ